MYPRAFLGTGPSLRPVGRPGPDVLVPAAQRLQVGITRTLRRVPDSYPDGRSSNSPPTLRCPCRALNPCSSRQEGKCEHVIWLARREKLHCKADLCAESADRCSVDSVRAGQLAEVSEPMNVVWLHGHEGLPASGAQICRSRSVISPVGQSKMCDRLAIQHTPVNAIGNHGRCSRWNGWREQQGDKDSAHDLDMHQRLSCRQTALDWPTVRAAVSDMAFRVCPDEAAWICEPGIRFGSRHR